jgi:hypothetical protein
MDGSLRADEPPALGDWQSVVLKHDRFYKHNIMRLNYTTYDVRREEDTIHAGISHCNVMTLNSAFADDSRKHPFCYAHVLGIFHANVVYLGEQNLDYRPRRLEFLWVRWYSVDEDVQSGWKGLKLDRIRFPPITNNTEAFGFLDPVDVLRGCHVIPAFSQGKVHPDGRHFSGLARDQNDWIVYYINRYLGAIKFFQQHSQFFLGLWIVTWYSDIIGDTAWGTLMHIVGLALMSQRYHCWKLKSRVKRATFMKLDP